MKNIIRAFLLVSILNNCNVFADGEVKPKADKVSNESKQKSFFEKVEEQIQKHPGMAIAAAVLATASGVGLGLAYKNYQDKKYRFNPIAKIFFDREEFEKLSPNTLKKYLEEKKKEIIASTYNLVEVLTSFQTLESVPSFVYSESFRKKLPKHMLVYVDKYMDSMGSESEKSEPEKLEPKKLENIFKHLAKEASSMLDKSDDVIKSINKKLETLKELDDAKDAGEEKAKIDMEAREFFEIEVLANQLKHILK